jgi:hypothetical protein
MTRVEGILASPPNRNRLVVQLFTEDGQWGEVISTDDKMLVLELYPKATGSWELELDQVINALQLSKQKLIEIYGSPNN